MTGETRELAQKIRLHVVEMTNRASASHVGSCLSAAEILATLYEDILRVDPERPNWPERDRFIVSKGHAAAAVYAVLAEKGFFPRDWLDSFYVDGGRLAGHVTHWKVPGVELSTGSLGHGLSMAAGMAYASKTDELGFRVFTLLSDGECDEGSTWEAAMFAPFHRLDNLIAIVDYNKIQSLGFVKEILDLEPFAEKWRAFGWAVRELDGHDITKLIEALGNVPWEPGKPSCVIAHTVKGKGVSFMENDVLWHYRTPKGEEYDAAVEELKVSR